MTWVDMEFDLGNWVLTVFQFLRFPMVVRVEPADMAVLVAGIMVVQVKVVVMEMKRTGLCFHGSVL